MTNDLLLLKIQERLNKLASNDYDNIERWQIQEAFNKVQIEFCRRIVAPKPGVVGDEQTKASVDDIQILLTEAKLNGDHKEVYFETDKLPKNYMSFKRLSAEAVHGDCPPRPLIVYQGEEADADILRLDADSGPSFEWAETFCTLFGNRIRIYTNDAFKIFECPKLIYYRFPRSIVIDGTLDTESGQLKAEQTCELKRDVIEILVDETAALLAGDIESAMQYQRNLQNAQRNT